LHLAACTPPDPECRYVAVRREERQKKSGHGSKRCTRRELNPGLGKIVSRRDGNAQFYH
jgi:hypothetical protein